jgi:hypothetical protein
VNKYHFGIGFLEGYVSGEITIWYMDPNEDWLLESLASCIYDFGWIW